MALAVSSEPIGLIIFDCDGVLVDSEPITNRVGQQLLAEYGLKLTLAEMDALFIGKSTPECVAIVEERLGHAPPADYLQEFGKRTQAAWRRELQPIPGIPQLLGTLGLPYCVASNGSAPETNFKLKVTGLLDRFEGRIFSGLDVPRPKPAPDVFLQAANAMGALPRQCLVIEDTPVGVTAAVGAGMQVIGYAPTGNREKLEAAGAANCIASMTQFCVPDS